MEIGYQLGFYVVSGTVGVYLKRTPHVRSGELGKQKVGVRWWWNCRSSPTTTSNLSGGMTRSWILYCYTHALLEATLSDQGLTIISYSFTETSEICLKLCSKIRGGMTSPSEETHTKLGGNLVSWYVEQHKDCGKLPVVLGVVQLSLAKKFFFSEKNQIISGATESINLLIQVVTCTHQEVLLVRVSVCLSPNTA